MYLSGLNRLRSMFIPSMMHSSTCLECFMDMMIDCVGAFGFRGRFVSGSTFPIFMSWFASSICAMISSDLSLSKSIACLDTPCSTILVHCSTTLVPSNKCFHSMLDNSFASLSDVQRILIP